jgi:hypothetical protein
VRAIALFGLLVAFPLVARVAHTASNDADYCYKIEKIRPNLRLSKPTQILGTLSDNALALMPNSRVELRKYISERQQVSVKVVFTDGSGRFDLGIVKPGEYRLLAAPLRAWAQPDKLSCTGSDTCELKIALVANPSDTSISSCPIR